MVSSSVTKDNLNDKVFRHKPKIEDLKVNFEKVSVENEGLKKTARFALSKANWNDQYFRKNNLKVHGMNELSVENVQEIVQGIFLKKHWQFYY